MIHQHVYIILFFKPSEFQHFSLQKAIGMLTRKVNSLSRPKEWYFHTFCCNIEWFEILKSALQNV